MKGLVAGLSDITEMCSSYRDSSLELANKSPLFNLQMNNTNISDVEKKTRKEVSVHFAFTDGSI